MFEFFLNQLRLFEGVRKEQFAARTGLAWPEVSGRIEEAINRGLLKDRGDVLKPTALGWRFSNETQQIFLPAEA